MVVISAVQKDFQPSTFRYIVRSTFRSTFYLNLKKKKKQKKNLNFEGLVKERQLSNLLCALNSYCNG